MSEYPFTMELILEDKDTDLIVKSFATLIKEMRFHRGYVEVVTRDNMVIIRAHAKDVTSLRSLINGVMKSLYLIFITSTI